MTEDALAQARRLREERERREAIERISGHLRDIDGQLEDVRLDLAEVDERTAESVSIIRDTIHTILERLRRLVR